jgi:hypothetical protein
MGDSGKGRERSILRLLLIEACALGGYLYLQSHPITPPLWNLNFRYNALFFLAAYPLLFVYRWKLAEGCLGMILWPLSFILSWGLGVSCYLWLTCGCYYWGSPFLKCLTRDEIILGFLFALVYFPLLQPLLGTTRKYFTLWEMAGTLFFSALGGFLGYLLGQFVDQKFGLGLGVDRRFPLWLGLILMGMAVGAFARGRGRE